MDSHDQDMELAEPFFDQLYADYYVHFPCYALLSRARPRFVTERADDGTAALVVLTDDDLVRRYRLYRTNGKGAVPVTLASPTDLANLVAGLPRDVTHVTFDPSPRFHRRYPLTVIRERLPRNS